MLRIITVIVSAVVFSSCGNKVQNELERAKAIEEGLFRSNGAILASTNVNYHKLEEKLSKAVSAQYASIWWPKAQMIKEKTKDIDEYIWSLIGMVESESGLVEKNGKQEIRGENLDAVKKIFGNERTGQELYQKLQNYRKDILDIDKNLRNQFGANVVLTTRDFDLDTNERKDFTKTFFDGVPAITAKMMLLQFENNVRIIENQCVTFCNVQVSDNDDVIYDSFSTLIGQSTDHIKAGHEMQIQAGVGAFTVKQNPVFTINGKEYKPELGEGVVHYKFKTPLKAGKYNVPVKIEYTDDWGKRQVLIQKVEYTVVE